MKYTEVKIIDVNVIEPYTLEVKFKDGVIREVDLKNILFGDLFGALRDLELFDRVRLNTEVNTIEWPNGADFHPETLYHWKDYKNEFERRAKTWKHSKTA